MELSDKQKEIVMNGLGTTSIAKLAKEARVNYYSVRKFLIDELSPEGYEEIASSNRKSANPLNEEEIQYIIDHNDEMTRKEIGIALGRSTATISRYAREIAGLSAREREKTSSSKEKRALNQYYLAKAMSMGL